MKSSSECLSSDMPLPMLVKDCETRDATLTKVISKKVYL